jgi:hypothetical protein
MKFPFRLLVGVVVLFVFNPPLQAQVPSPIVNFAATTYGVGNVPVSVTAADVNGDGKVDLICANLGDDSLTVLTNNGNGGFAIAGTNAVGHYPWSVTAADVNGDGKVDLICANFSDNTLTVLTNNGSGGFATASTNAVGNGPRSVTAADVNEDGNVDLICANSLTNTLSVLTNDGSGGFKTAGTYIVDRRPTSVVAADVNGNGKVDLICANSMTNTVSVLTNDGSGGFKTAGTYAVCGVDAAVQSVTAADVNGNGKVDLISANGVDETLTVLTNDGSGGFVLATNIAVDDYPESVVAADVNGDGKVDLIVSYTGTLAVLTNDGCGGFELAYTYNVSGNPNSVAAADVNGDGKVDLIYANEVNALTVLLNTSPFPTPMPTINQSGNSVVVSWPSFWTGWTLQQNSNLATTNWSASGGVSDDGTNKSLTITPATGNLFFRLAKSVN